MAIPRPPCREISGSEIIFVNYLSSQSGLDGESLIWKETLPNPAKCRYYLFLQRQFVSTERLSEETLFSLLTWLQTEFQSWNHCQKHKDLSCLVCKTYLILSRESASRITANVMSVSSSIHPNHHPYHPRYHQYHQIFWFRNL